MRTKELIGRKIIDAGGNEVGEVEDVEIDWDQKKVTALVLGGKGEISKRIFGRLASPRPDMPIPVEDIAVLGTVVVLSKKLT